MNAELKARLVKRLRYLQIGGEPADRYFGICHDVSIIVNEKGAQTLLRRSFCQLGLDEDYPLGYNEFSAPDLWGSDNGPARRKLAGDVADLIEGKRK